ncbi:hypothetical protein LINGRAHAP2_LOCUS18092, partial [Linum grandiflorum]
LTLEGISEHGHASGLPLLIGSIKVKNLN